MTLRRLVKKALRPFRPGIEAVRRGVLDLPGVGQVDFGDLRRLDFRLYEVRVKGDEQKFIARLAGLGWPVESAEDGLLKVFVPPDGQSLDLFRAAAAEGVQVRHFVRSQTSLEDLFARAVGVD